MANMSEKLQESPGRLAHPALPLAIAFSKKYMYIFCGKHQEEWHPSGLQGLLHSHYQSLL